MPTAPRSNPTPRRPPSIQRIFRELAGGKSMRQVAQGLTQEGIPTATGGESLGHLDRSPTSCGKSPTSATSVPSAPSARGGKTASTATRKREDHQIQLPEGTAPALITPEIFAAVQARLIRNKAEAARNNADPEGALLRGGYAICGYCGTNLTATKHAPTGLRNYCCQSSAGERNQHKAFSMMAPKLDPLMWEWVKERIGHPGIMRAELELQRHREPARRRGGGHRSPLVNDHARQDRLSRAIALIDDDDAAAPLLDELRTLANAAA